MEHAGSAPDVASPHLEDLRQLVSRPGSFLTVVVARPEPIAKAVEAAVNDACRALTGTTGEGAADELANAVRRALPHDPGVVVIIEDDRVVLVEALDEEPRRPGLYPGSLPLLAPIVRRRSAAVPTVAAMVDRTGADLSWSSPLPGGATVSAEAHVDSDAPHIRKVPGGGWSHRRYQQSAQDAWEHTAAEVAEGVTDLIEGIGARLVLLGGEDRMVHLVRDGLSESAAALVRTVPGGRSEDGSEEERAEVAARFVRTVVAEDTRALLQKFDEEKGQNDRAADGLEGTLAAFRESRVETLLVHDDGTDERTACFDPTTPTLVAADPVELEEHGARDLRVGRAPDVAIRTALLTGADVRVVPDTPRLFEGIGALLRW